MTKVQVNSTEISAILDSVPGGGAEGIEFVSEVSPVQLEAQLLALTTQCSVAMQLLAETCAISIVKLQDAEIEAIATKAGLGADLFCKLAEIGASDQIAKHCEALPLDIFALHVLAHMKDEEFQRALEQGIITRDLRLSKALQWQGENHRQNSAHGDSTAQFELKAKMNLHETATFTGLLKYISDALPALTIQRVG